MNRSIELIAGLKRVSGNNALDFSNTADREGSKVIVERLNTYDDLIVWSLESGLLDHAQADYLRQRALEQPTDSQAALLRAIEFREALYAVCSAIAAQSPVNPSQLAILNNFVVAGSLHHQLRLGTGQLEWAWIWQENSPLFDYPVWKLAHIAADLLTTQTDKLRECGAKDCGWLFLDTSRNHSRRWCDMTDCGNREKAKRHYRRSLNTDG